MNASAMSEMKSIPCTIFVGTRFRQNGPSRMPAIMYAVTFGSLASFVSLVIANPPKSISATEIITDAAGDILSKAARIESIMLVLLG